MRLCAVHYRFCRRRRRREWHRIVVSATTISGHRVVGNVEGTRNNDRERQVQSH